MSSKDKENKSIQEKLKQFFRFTKSNTGSFRGRNDFVLTEEMQRDLGRDSPMSTRTKILKDLCDDVLTHRLEDKAIEKLWYLVQDLLQYNQSSELRHLTFTFLQNLVRGQIDKLDLLRAHFFRVIKHHEHSEDVAPRFDLLNALTENGKDVRFFEEEIGLFLLKWLPDITRVGKTQDYLELLMNVIKFNAAYLDEEVVAGFVQNVCLLSYNSSQQNIVLSCLQVLDTIVAYSNLPTESLPNFVVALCRIVNIEVYCQNSWKVMRNLMGTHMGHSTLFTMCRILQEAEMKQETALLRGAVFFICMSLWGPFTQPLSNLRCPPSCVLPSILQAIDSNHAIVTYEIVLSMQNLINNKHRLLLHEPTWDVIFKILTIAIRNISSNPNLPAHKYAAAILHDTLNVVENLIETGNFHGSLVQFYDIIETCSATRPEESVLKLILFLSKRIVPTKHLWLSNLNILMQKYFRLEQRTNVRLKVIEVLSHIVELNRKLYEDELIDKIIVPHLSSSASDCNVIIRTAVVDLLIKICIDCKSKRCIEVLEVLEKFFNRPFEYHGPDSIHAESEITDLKNAVVGLVKVFKLKIHKLPSSHALQIYKIFVHHLEQHYARPRMFEECNLIRYKIFQCFLNMRADSYFHLGCIETNGKIKYSPYLCVSYNTMERGSVNSPPPLALPSISQLTPCTVTFVPLRRSFKTIITCLRQEKDWEVLKLVLHEIPRVLQNKSLVLGKNGNNEMDMFVDALCSMLTDKSLCLPESLRNPNKPNRSDFHACVLQVLSSLPSYHAYIDSNRQQKMIWCLVKCGLVPKCSRSIISALMTCTLEMGNVLMIRLLPDVLLDLSKISATVNIAIPVLEFLSTVSKLPAIYANFVGDQYMALFAICLPYTNPFKYNHYIVSLAHHVIAVWFLKCRLPFRRVFISYITKGLQTNTLVPFDETNALKMDLNVLKTDMSKLNQDSSDRKRSSSLTEQSSRRKEQQHASVAKATPLRQGVINRALITFYEELTETCNDLMARYTFSTCSALPKRFPAADALFSGGHSMTWLLGNKLITITTSGCKQKQLRYGLCDPCWLSCRIDKATNLPEREDSSSNQGCTCWCQGWAEIYVRRPTGDMCWVMRIQNQLSHQQSSQELPLSEISTLFVNSIKSGSSGNDGNGSVNSGATSSPIDIPQRKRHDSVDDEAGYEDGSKNRNPVRRSNSSPEMSGNWKNPFLQKEREDIRSGDHVHEEEGSKKTTSKSMRGVSCEAIPEEMAGTGTDTTPPNYTTVENKPPQSPTTSKKDETTKLRDRVHTISVMTNVRKPRLDDLRRTNSPRSNKEGPRSGISPSFIFLQLYHSSHFGSVNEKPILVGTSPMVQRAIKILDLVRPYETHSIGVIYVSDGQGNNETEILANKYGSVRYVQFLQNLGTLIDLREVDPHVVFLGGLHQDGNAGKYAYIWQDDVIRVVFHVATLMPNNPNDLYCNNKKMHIGNNNVTIVYNESGDDYNINTIKGQFNFACIIVQPLDYGTNKVTVKTKEELSELIGQCEPKIVSDQNVALLARQLALHADLAAFVSRSLKNQAQNPYASNWLERLRKIKQLKTKIMQEKKKDRPGSQEDISIRNRRGSIDDFTEYTS